jgi:bacillithiol system protein YtxJ
MSFIKKLFGTTTEVKDTKLVPWIALNSIEHLKEIEAKSATKTQVIFKHSTRCGISRMVLSQFKKDFDTSSTNLDLHFLDLLNHRDISNAIAERFNVVHESPQLLIIKNGIAVSNASHGSINDLDLQQYT